MDIQLATLAMKTGMSIQDWRDFLACSPEEQALIAKTYADASWVKNRDVFADVLTVLGVVGVIAGDVTGVGSAIAAIRAL